MGMSSKKENQYRGLTMPSSTTKSASSAAYASSGDMEDKSITCVTLAFHSVMYFSF
jgi:hypothetical protein